MALVSVLLAAAWALPGARGREVATPSAASPAVIHPRTQPIGFLANEGQLSNPGVRYYYDAGPSLLGFGRGHVLYVLRPAGDSGPGAFVRWTFLGSRPAEPVGVDPTGYRANFLLGNDPASWHVHVPAFSGIRYAGVYDGIDLVFLATPQGVKYEYLVQPGAALDPLLVQYEGAESIRVDGDGALIIRTAAGDIRDTAPVADQMGVPVSCSFDVRSPTAAGLACPGRNPSETLRIDPMLYATFIGGSGTDVAQSVAVDSNGDAFVTGATASLDFPTTPGAFNRTYQGGCGGYLGCADAFVLKANATGTNLYATFLGGTGYDKAYAIVVDELGNAYIAGNTSSSNFPTTTGAYDRSLGGAGDAFVTKLSPNGDALLYSTYLGGSSLDGANGLAVDTAHDAYVTGYTESANFPTTTGAYNRTYTNPAAFVVKLSASGTTLAYATFIGSTYSGGNAIAVDAGGNAFITGQTAFSDYPTTPGSYTRTFRIADTYVTKLNAAGSALVYSTFLGGTRWETGYSIAVDPAGEAFVAGQTNSTDFPTTPGAYNTTQTYLGKGGIGFVTKFNTAGNGLAYSTYLRGTYDIPYGLALDSAGDAYVTGVTLGGFPTTPGALQPTNRGGFDAFVAELNAGGSAYVASTYLGGSAGDAAYGIAIGPSNRIYVVGATGSSDFPTPWFGRPYSGNGDGFLAAFSSLTGSLLYRTTVDTSPSGLQLWVNGTLVPTPYTFYCNSGDTLTLEAPTPQLVNATTYAFQAWSDGGAARHTVSCGGSAAYTATYVPSAQPDFVLIVNPTSASTYSASSITFYVTVIGVNGYAGPAVNVSLRSAVAGIQGTCSGSSNITPTGTCSMFVQVTAPVPTGTYTLTFQGTNGTATRSTAAQLYVSPGTPGAYLSLQVSPRNLTVPAGDAASFRYWVNWSQTVQLLVALSSGAPSGLAVNLGPDTAVGNVSWTATLVVASSVTPGNYLVYLFATYAPLGMVETVVLQVTVTQSQLRPLLTDALAWFIAGVAIFFAVLLAVLFFLARRRRPEPPREPEEPPP